MFRKDEVFPVREPDCLGGFKWLRFTEDAAGIHGSRIKYMAEVVPACDRFARAGERDRITVCAGCLEDCYARKMLIKYAGPFVTDEEAGTERALNAMLQIERQGEVDIRSPFIARTLLGGREMAGDVEIAYVVMEKAEGEELRRLIERFKVMEKTDPDRAALLRLNVMRQFLFGIRAYARQYADSFQVHRDLKPENIIVRSLTGPDGSVSLELKIIDFDLMVRQRYVKTYGLFTGGTVGYVHPEAYRKADLPDDPEKQFCHEWDLYAAGLIMYEIMEGKRHFTDDAYLEDPDMAFRLKETPSCADLPELEAIIRRLVAGEYHHIDQVIADYQEMLDGAYGRFSYPAFYLNQFLECRPGYEAGMPYVNVNVKTASEGLLDVMQNFRVTYNTVTNLSYGRNVIGLGAADYEEETDAIGSFCFINGRLKFIPLLPDCEGVIRDGYGQELASEIVRPGFEIRYKDVTMTVIDIEDCGTGTAAG